MSIQLEILNLVNKDIAGNKPPIFIIKIANLLDTDRTRDAWDILKIFINGGVKYILIDMENLDFIDSLGISLLINTAKLIRSNHGDLGLVNVSQKIDNILNPIYIQRFMKIFTTPEESIQYFRMI